MTGSSKLSEMRKSAVSVDIKCVQLYALELMNTRIGMLVRLHRWQAGDRTK